MKILLIDNNFQGAYGSFNTFLNEIENSLIKTGNIVYKVNNIDEAILCYENKSIDFSLGIGKYLMFIENKALCDKYNIYHYQWIIDNPIKIGINQNIKNIIPIFIDLEFPTLWSPPLNDYLYLPLGIDKLYKIVQKTHRKNGIIFAGQIKNLNQIEEQINYSKDKNIIWQFLNTAIQDLNLSFISQYNKFRIKKNINNEEEFFKLTNSYLRCYKRLKIIKNIKDYPLILVGNIEDKEIISKSNVNYLGKLPYNETNKLFYKYNYALNINPNFSYCIHDRILHALIAGCQVITDKNPLINEIFGKHLIYFDYNNSNKDIFNYSLLNEKIKNIKCSDINKCLTNFTWENTLSIILNHYLKRKYGCV